MGLPAETRPKLARGIRLQFDAARDQWILQAPERVLVLDEIAAEVLQRCTGEADITAIIASLAAAFDAEPGEIAADVDELLTGLIEKRIIAT
ncbi:MAG: pyrroloquinoline quinone biosynthesis peptide chaperone PqqD [Rhodospirillaceae bacterium]|nr:MAG: pyrroloquinoline quinone biosynthesis peptide chaperone PqqD [Rhodospirillaceae bacterium]